MTKKEINKKLAYEFYRTAYQLIGNNVNIENTFYERIKENGLTLEDTHNVPFNGVEYLVQRERTCVDEEGQKFVVFEPLCYFKYIKGIYCRSVYIELSNTHHKVFFKTEIRARDNFPCCDRERCNNFWREEDKPVIKEYHLE